MGEADGRHDRAREEAPQGLQRLDRAGRRGACGSRSAGRASRTGRHRCALGECLRPPTGAPPRRRQCDPPTCLRARPLTRQDDARDVGLGRRSRRPRVCRAPRVQLRLAQPRAATRSRRSPGPRGTGARRNRDHHSRRAARSGARRLEAGVRDDARDPDRHRRAVPSRHVRAVHRAVAERPTLDPRRDIRRAAGGRARRLRAADLARRASGDRLPPDARSHARLPRPRDRVGAEGEADRLGDRARTDRASDAERGSERSCACPERALPL